MRTFHTGGVAGEDITHGLPRVVELFEARTPKGAALLAESSGVVRIGENEKGERTITIVADDGDEELHAVSMRTHLAPGHRGRCRGRRRCAADRRRQDAAGPEEDPRHRRHPDHPAVPRRRGPEGVPGAGRVDPRQARRGDRPPDAAARRGLRAGRLGVPARSEGRRPGVREREQAARGRGQAPGRGSSRAHGDHQGLARDRVVAVRRLLPGDDAGAHRSRDRGQERRPRGPQGERHHRQADPGRDRHAPVPRRRHRGPRLRAAALLHQRLRGRPRPRRAAPGLARGPERRRGRLVPGPGPAPASEPIGLATSVGRGRRDPARRRRRGRSRPLADRTGRGRPPTTPSSPGETATGE